MNVLHNWRKDPAAERVPLMRVAAPGNESGLRPPALVAVDVEEGDDVHWVWTYLADGRRVVTGCSFVRRADSAASLNRKH